MSNESRCPRCCSRWQLCLRSRPQAAAATTTRGGGRPPTDDREQVSGSVSVMGIWVGEEQKSFQAVIDGFKERATRTSPSTTTRSATTCRPCSSTAVAGRESAGHRGDRAARTDDAVRRAGRAEAARLRREHASSTNFGQSVVDTGSVEGTLYGLLWKANNASTVWYNVKAFEDAGVEPPETWDAAPRGRRRRSRRRACRPTRSPARTAGRSPTCSRTSTCARRARRSTTSSPAHEIPWTDQSVKEALTEMAKVFGDADNLAGGTAGALQTDFPTSVSNVLSPNPKAAMVIEADFVPGVVRRRSSQRRATTSSRSRRSTTRRRPWSRRATW